MPATPTDPGALAPDDAPRLTELVAAVIAAPAPAQILGETLETLRSEQKPVLAAALYESVCYRVTEHDYWLHFAMARIYSTLGRTRDDATFLHAAAAVQLHPDWSGADVLWRDMFLILVRRGCDRAALDLFRHQVALQPESPAAWPHELAPVLARLGEAEAVPRPAPPSADEAVWRRHPVIDADVLAPRLWPTFGGPLPAWLAPLTKPQRRPPVTVGEFADADLLMYRHAIVVLDRRGNIHPDFCVGEFPGATHAHVAALAEREPQAVPLHEVDEAVLISDHFPTPNIGHLLFDQITRLALYQRLGVPIERALVIGPERALPAQKEIVRRAGVAAYLGTDRIARVRARRLWVSSNCHELRHPLHLGAAWALDYTRDILGGRGTKGWRRLFISRADMGARQVANEAEVMALLETHGFEAILPARIPYAAQIAAFKQASHVAGPHGAGLSHILLCPPGAHVLEIFHPLYGNSAYATLAAGTDLRYAALLGRDWDSDAPEWNDPTQVDTSGGRFFERHVRVDLATLAGYLATLD